MRLKRIGKKHGRFLRSSTDQNGMDPIDCLNFAIMERMGIKEAFTFDRDFEIYGFKKDPF